MSKKYHWFWVLVFLGFLGCAGQKEQVIRIDTRYGEIVAVLFDDTPVHKSNFIELAEAGRFDSTEFHRVIPEFMVQGGDVFSKEEMPAEEWPTLPAEIRPNHFHKKGMIAAARQGNNINPERRSSGSQFYIVLGQVYDELELTTDMAKLQAAFMQYVQLQSQDSLRATYTQLYEQQDFDSLTRLILSKRDEIEQSLNLKLTKDLSAEQLEAYTTVGGTPHLDGEYTVFGEVIQGLEVAEKISLEPRGSRDKPLDPIYMTIRVEAMTPAQIEREFGYIIEDGK
ncbi:MAG: peptidylprolyl isomerase [Algoriphagus sp.]|uniref:peptidylprolyl isomerase n=1 Tax=Algoriphagus sp. TaxID=1872435 RepID=UPI001856B7CD|nr:peptidylprolyl isomerase [Algoriphagus sp.]NVJ84860.1 peptidylprolyl isomerase [Algoriphagus sp.]